MNHVFVLLLIIAIFFLSRKSFQFEKLKDSNFIAIYCIVLFFVTMIWDRFNIILLACIALVSAGIGWFQSSKIELKKSENADEKSGYLIKKNYPYLIGWLLVIILGIAIECFINGSFFSEIVESFAGEVKAEILPFSIFGSERPWYIWALSGFSSLTYMGFVRLKKRRIENELANKPKN